MSDLNTYFSQHFLNTEQLAAVCQLSQSNLLDLIQHQLIPGPSYVVSKSTARSYVFRELPADGATDGEYFHPATEVWANIARHVIDEVGRHRAYEALKQRFAVNLQCALADLNASVWRLRDSFADDGAVIHEGLRIRTESVWEHFLHGTFGLCVANPISEAAIARKEVLQEKLTALSENGTKKTFSEGEARTVLELIDAYATAAMPFSPIEYPISSRKRLVEDLSTRVKAVQQGAATDSLSRLS